MKIERALISVFDKTGLEELVETLSKFGVEIISSGGTARAIREMGYDVIDVSEYTGYPESPDGLVKTLQPMIHGGLLLNPEIESHKEYMEQQGIPKIDMVVCNLYPFEATIQKEGITLEEAAKQIDIGGPTMIRAAAKPALLYKNVCVVVDPEMYGEITEKLNENDGSLDEHTMLWQASYAFSHTSEYEFAIDDFVVNQVVKITKKTEENEDD